MRNGKPPASSADYSTPDRQDRTLNDKLLYRISEVAEYLSLSRSKTYELVRAGHLPSVRVDGVRRVRGVDVVAFVESLRVS